MLRRDFAMPFAIDAASGQAAQSSYQDHVEQMIRQVLLTDPGERVCLPTFGAGLRRLLFAPLNASITATTAMIVTQSLESWMGGQIQVRDVAVFTAGSPGLDEALPDGAIVVRITYVLVETQTVQQTQVQVV